MNNYFLKYIFDFNIISLIFKNMISAVLYINKLLPIVTAFPKFMNNKLKIIYDTSTIDILIIYNLIFILQTNNHFSSIFLFTIIYSIKCMFIISERQIIERNIETRCNDMHLIDENKLKIET